MESEEVIPAPNLPDWEETQIIDKEDEQREVALYLSTKNGRVDGAECTPFVLPRRWTYDTLLACVKDYISRTTTNDAPVNIEQLYYKKSKGKAVVKISNDSHIPALIQEYPFCYRNGKKKNSTMYLAVDLKKAQPTPRRSPRVLARSTMDIFLHEINKDMKVSAEAEIVHKVKCDTTYQDLVTILKTHENQDKIYTPSKGLYYLRKGTKQLVSLKQDDDLEKCKEEYACKQLRLACYVVHMNDTEDSLTSKRKRKLEFSSKEDNEIWNESHVSLVADLEKRGTLWRYGTQHLKLWTDKIIEGQLGGSNEEPDWEKYSDQLTVPPKSKRSRPLQTPSNSPPGQITDTTGSMIEMMKMMQQQMFLNLASSFNMNQVPPSFRTPQTCQSLKKALHEMNADDCINVLQCIGLGKHSESFRANGVNGVLLESLTNPHMGKQMMVNLGLSEENERHILLAEVYRLKSLGYNNLSATPQ